MMGCNVHIIFTPFTRRLEKLARNSLQRLPLSIDTSFSDAIIYRRFLVVANAVAAAYSLVQGLRCVVCMLRGKVLFSKPLAWIIFSGDQVNFRSGRFPLKIQIS